MKRYPLVLAALAILTLLSTLAPTGIVASMAAPKAFPGAMGYGTDTPGGRGGRVIYVTNLKDSGTGSLRAALTASGPRTILFKVSGTITLASDIKVENPYLTVAGQTAPGEGVQIRGGHIMIVTHDVLIRYLKMRTGDAKTNSNNDDRDAMSANHSSAYNIVIDNSTLIWGPDVGGITFLNGVHDSTISNSIIGEGLYISNHSEGTVNLNGHSMGMNITELSSGSSGYPTRITLHHNLLTTSSDRNPRIIGGKYVDMVNNVIYNWQHLPAYGNPRSLNLVNNFYIRGPMTTRSSSRYAWIPKAESGGSLRSRTVYESGNVGEGLTGIRGGSSSTYTSTRFSPYSITREDTPQNAYNQIVNGAGANLQVKGSDGSFVVRRDSVDQRIINNLVNRKGAFLNGVNANGAAGFASISWPTLASGTPATDNDNDGMPDAWESTNFGKLTRGSANDSKSDYDGDGYTDLEEYLNGTNPTAP